MLCNRLGLLLTAIACIALSPAGQANPATNFPNQVVRLVAPYPPGGTNDTLARLLAPKLTELWKQSVIVENRTGASGIIGTRYVAEAAGDGHTLLFGSNGALTVTPNMRNDVPYDAEKDLVPVVNLGSMPSILVVNPNVPAKTVPEFIAYLKQDPGKHNYASSGTNSTTYLMMELFLQQTGTKMQHVPYKGYAPAEMAVIQGDALAAFDSAMTGLPFVQAGKMRGIGIATLEPWPLAPDMPLIADTLPGFESGTFVGVFVPRSTPPALVKRLQTDFQTVLKDPLIRKRLLELGAMPSSIGQPSEELRAYIRTDSEKWKRVVRALGGVTN